MSGRSTKDLPNKGYKLRPQRFPVRMSMLVRPKGARNYSFEVLAVDFSVGGFRFIVPRSICIPMQVKTIIHATIDLHCHVFPRPLHMSLELVRTREIGEEIEFGVQIVEISAEHKKLFTDTVEKFLKSAT